jgi:hypothetical protein
MARVLTLRESMNLAQRHRLPLAQTRFAKDEKELLAAAKRLRPPWVLKVSSAEAVHKTEKGLVETGINTPEELAVVAKRLRQKMRGMTYDALVLQEQRKGAELLVGAVKDASFGHAVAFGSGGMLVELFKDVAWRVTPLTPRDAREMVLETKASAFTKPAGFRGRHASLNALANLLVRTSRLLEREPRVTELDFNPVIADARKALIVDARIVLEK